MIMARYPSDLPFNQDDSPKLIPWIIGLMIYLAVLSLVGSMTLSRMIEKWDQGFRHGFSVELSPPEGISPEAMNFELQRQKKVLNILSSLPGIRRTQVIAKTSLGSTVDSWLGSEEENIGLPLPTIIDVEVAPGVTFDTANLQDALEKAVPGTTVINDREWRAGLKKIASIFLTISIIVASLIGCATVAISCFTTHTGLIIYQRIIEILHLVGARNAYIAKQFQSHTLRLGLKAGGIGFAFSVITFLGLIWSGSTLELPRFLQEIPFLEISLITTIFPLVVAIAMMGTARITVLWELRDLP